MFTGIIEGTGRVTACGRAGADVRLRIEAPFLEEPRRGESVATDGVCLTVVAGGAGWFEAIASPETLSRTTLGRLSRGDRVNLERPLRVGDRLGGHLVQGHVDAVAIVESSRPEGSGRRVRIGIPAGLQDLIVMKGSIAVDGVSLTVAARLPQAFEVALIPETLAITRLSEYAAGTRVNLEVDMMGRYVIEYLKGMGFRRERGVTREHLARHGFGEREERP